MGSKLSVFYGFCGCVLFKKVLSISNHNVFCIFSNISMILFIQLNYLEFIFLFSAFFFFLNGDVVKCQTILMTVHTSLCDLICVHSIWHLQAFIKNLLHELIGRMSGILGRELVLANAGRGAQVCARSCTWSSLLSSQMVPSHAQSTP